MGKRLLSLCMAVLVLTNLVVIHTQAASETQTALLRTIAYYGDASQCQMTAEQALTFVNLIETENVALQRELERQSPYRNLNGKIHTYAALIDTGNGIPALFYAGGFVSSYFTNDITVDGCFWHDIGTVKLWQYIDGKAVLYSDERDINYHDSYLFVGGGSSDGWEYGGEVYSIANGKISEKPITIAHYITNESDDTITYTVDGQQTTEAMFNEWVSRWDDAGVVGHRPGGGVEGRLWGMRSSESTVTALKTYASISDSEEFIYDSPDLGENTKVPAELLEEVTNTDSAAKAIQQMTDGMSNEQKSSPTGIDLATLYAETAVSKAASKMVDGDVIISADSVADIEAAAAQAASAVETALVNGGITTARYLSNTVTLTTNKTGEITIKIDPDILTTKVDKIRVETPAYALTLKVADLAEDLTEVLTITAEEVGSGFAPGKANRKVTVKISLPRGKTTNPVTVSLPTDTGNTTYQAVVKTDGSATSSKYNPATTTMDGKVNTSGTYTVKTNEKSFTDISNKSAEMQKAILYLTSKGIINGTSATTFSPNGTINRQQIAALIMRALGKVDNSATVSFKDVSASSSLYHEIASSKKHKIINGYSDNTFRGTNVISKAQIVTVAGRVLVSEMNYKIPANSNSYLGKYSDAVPDFAKEMTALATRENLVVYRTDGTFSGNKNMTRGDAAIILYRLFQKIW